MQVTSPTQSYDLVYKPLFQHLCESLCNSVVQDLAIRRGDGQVGNSIGQLRPSRSGCVSTLRRLSLAVGGHARSADPIDFQRPTQALGVIGVDARRRDRVDDRQLVVQGLPAQACGLFLDFGTDLDGRAHV